ncbi:polysaccharide deacetylase family protein [Halegenticoccus tardaugens]|uniref:polysaccharide deacetylase family protein n=1 Tax=Halegenticoccus tardaugens TaxID=2071624 RepID=UPI00100BAD55|nr:polysaccharide deacetylase family protein [Halegenticoccus tardaugens]
MREIVNRRKFIAALGAAGAASFAGCAGSGGETPSNEETPGSDDDSTGTDGEQPGGESPFTRGELVEDFEDFENANWGMIRGDATSDSNEVYAGSQSLSLENKNGEVAGIYKAFPEGLDLTKHDLSLAVKLDKPAAGYVAAEIIAPARSDMLTSRRYIPQELNGWVRIDFGYTERRGEPIMRGVQELRLMVLSDEGTAIQARIDDLRRIPKPEKGKVIFQFDDNHISQYETAFDILKKEDMPGSVGVIPDSVGYTDKLTDGHMREMRDAGWDMMAHPQSSEPLPAYPADKQREMIQSAKRYLELKGFPDGARHFVAPYNRVSNETLDIVSEFHETGFLQGACPNNAVAPSSMHTISRVNGEDVEGVQQILNIAEDTGQMVVIAYHDIGDGDDYETTTDQFESIVNHVAGQDIDVVTPTQFLDGE